MRPVKKLVTPRAFRIYSEVALHQPLTKLEISINLNIGSKTADAAISELLQAGTISKLRIGTILNKTVYSIQPGQDVQPQALHPPEFMPTSQRENPKVYKDRRGSFTRNTLPFFKLWNSHEVRKHRLDENSKVCQDSAKRIRALLSGTLYKGSIQLHRFAGRSFSLSEMEISLERFVLARNNHRYLPTSKTYLEHLDLSTFLYDMRNDKSYFLYFLEHVPQQIGKPVMDAYPTITRQLMQFYRHGVMNGYTGDLPFHVQVSLVQCAQRCHALLAGKMPEPRMGTWLISTLREIWGNRLDKAQPSWFSSDILWKDEIPRHMNRNKETLEASPLGEFSLHEPLRKEM